MMQAGRLDRRVALKEKVVTKDSYGQEVITWSTITTVWGEVQPLTGREFMEGRQVEAEVSTRIRIRYLPGIEPEDRAEVVIDGSTVVYDILAVLPVGMDRREIQLMCREVDA